MATEYVFVDEWDVDAPAEPVFGPSSERWRASSPTPPIRRTDPHTAMHAGPAIVRRIDHLNVVVPDPPGLLRVLTERFELPLA